VHQTVASPLLGSAVGGGAAVATLFALRAADNGNSSPLRYVVSVPLSGVAALTILAVLLESARLIARRRAG
jgi:hypothetical protein